MQLLELLLNLQWETYSLLTSPLTQERRESESFSCRESQIQLLSTHRSGLKCVAPDNCNTTSTITAINQLNTQFIKNLTVIPILKLG